MSSLAPASLHSRGLRAHPSLPQNFISNHLCAISTGAPPSAPTAAPAESLPDEDPIAASPPPSPPPSPSRPLRTAEVAVQCGLPTTPSPVKRRTTKQLMDAVTPRTVTVAAVKRPRDHHQLPQVCAWDPLIRLHVPTAAGLSFIRCAAVLSRLLCAHTAHGTPLVQGRSAELSTNTTRFRTTAHTVCSSVLGQTGSQIFQTACSWCSRGSLPA